MRTFVITMQSPPDRTPLSPLSMLIRFATVGLISGGTLLLFLFAGGWFSPHAVTPKKFVDRFEHIDGLHAGFRRNHAKGLCFSGTFDSNGDGVPLSTAKIFAAGTTPVIGRFALGGGMPMQVDKIGTVRSMAVQFNLADGEQWRTGCNNIPVFPVHTPEMFYDFLLASAPAKATGKPDPALMGAFLTKHPEVKKSLALLGGRAVASGFDNSTFNSLNAFRFTNAAGTVSYVRWAFVPEQPFLPATTQPATTRPTMSSPNYLFDDVIRSAAAHPLKWHLVITVAEAGDNADDASIPWPPGRQQVDVGTLTVDRIEPEESSPARDINFDPLVLPAGIGGSNDPLLSARSAAYAVSYKRREGETKTPSAITPGDVKP